MLCYYINFSADWCHSNVHMIIILGLIACDLSHFLKILFVLQMRTFLQIWLQKNPVQELRIVPTNLEESLYPREQCAQQRQTWRYVSIKLSNDLLFIPKHFGLKCLFPLLQGASTSTTENFGHRPKRPRVTGKCQDLPGNLRCG